MGPIFFLGSFSHQSPITREGPLVKKFPRSTPLTAAGVAAAMLLSTTVGTVGTASAQSSLSSLSSGSSLSSLSSSSSGSRSSSGSGGSGGSTPSNPHEDWADDVSDGLDVSLVGDILGRGISDHVGFLSGDLGTMAPISKGEEFAMIFGDSFTGPRFGEGDWLSPVGVVARLDDDGRVEILRPLNDDDEVEQLVDYRHNDRGLTLIPSDIVNIDGDLYMQAMWNEGIGNVLRTEIFGSKDNGATWKSLSTKPANYLQGMGQLITWEEGPDGYVYAMSTSFQRADPVFLARFKPEDIGDRDDWEYYSFDSSGNGTWGTKATSILDQSMQAGEMSLRYIEDHWVLAMFNEETMAIEVRISEDIARDWDEIEPANVVVSGHGGWGQSQTPSNFTQLYGGYIVPGSTLDDLDLVVSQWNTSNNSRYMSTQFNVKGLEEFFGIDQGPVVRAATAEQAPASDRVGDQSVLKVTESELDAETSERLATEKQMEDSSRLTVVPLGEGR